MFAANCARNWILNGAVSGLAGTRGGRRQWDAPLVGIVVGSWHFDAAGRGLPADELPAIAALGSRLQAATGLRVELRDAGRTLRIPTLREELFDFDLEGSAITVHAFAPVHPYLWENLDGVMTAAGGRADTADHVWKPDPRHVGLRARWETLSPRDRFLLAMPSLLGARPFDPWLSR